MTSKSSKPKEETTYSTANDRYNERIKSVLADRGSRELHKLVIENLHSQCMGETPFVDGMKDLTKEQRGFACKAISDRRDILNYENSFDAIIDWFIIITGKRYNGESFEQIIRDIQSVQLSLMEQAQKLGLFGDMRKIHQAVVIDELAEFDDETLLNYCELLFIPFPDAFQIIHDSDPSQPSTLSEEQRDELEAYTIFGKLSQLEKLRIDSFIYDTLFGDVDNRGLRYEGSLTFYDVPSVDDILSRGFSYYYPRVGAITNEDLIDRFHPYELLLILSEVSRSKMIAKTSWNSYDISSRIITALQYRSWDDPRAFITPFGIRNNIIGSPYISILNLNRDFLHSYDDLKEVCDQEGIRTEGWHGRPRAYRDLYHDYIIAQLSEDFYLKLPETIDRLEVSQGIYIAANELIPHPSEPRTDVIWYGGRNGTTQFRCMTIKCLTDLWSQTNAFTCPFDTSSVFPIRQIRKLQYVLSREGLSFEIQGLSSLVTTLIWPATRRFGIPTHEKELILSTFDKQELLINTMRKSYTRERLSAKLKLLRNLGTYFSYWTDEGPVQLVKRITDGSDDLQGFGRANALFALSSILYSLEDVPELLELKIVKLLVESPTVEKTHPDYFDQAAPYPLIEIEMDASTIGEYLKMLVSAHRFGIDTLLEYAGAVLTCTTEKYARELIDMSFTHVFKLEVLSPHLEIIDHPNTIESSLQPGLLDIKKGTSTPVDTSNGKWQDLPILAS